MHTENQIPSAGSCCLHNRSRMGIFRAPFPENRFVSANRCCSIYPSELAVCGAYIAILNLTTNYKEQFNIDDIASDKSCKDIPPLEESLFLGSRRRDAEHERAEGLFWINFFYTSGIPVIAARKY